MIAALLTVRRTPRCAWWRRRRSVQFVSSDARALNVLDLSCPGSTRPSIEKKHFDQRGMAASHTRVHAPCDALRSGMVAGDGAAPTIRRDEHPRPREFS